MAFDQLGQKISQSASLAMSSLHSAYQSEKFNVNIKSFLIGLVCKDISTSFNILLVAGDLILYTPLYHQLLICAGKLEAINNIVAQCSAKFDASMLRLQSLYSRLCRDFHVTANCLNYLYFQYEQAMKPYYSRCISAMIQVMSELVWSYFQSSEVFQFEYAKCDASIITQFDIELAKCIFSLKQPLLKNELRSNEEFDCFEGFEADISRSKVNEKSKRYALIPGQSVFKIIKKSISTDDESLKLSTEASNSSSSVSQSISPVSSSKLFKVQAISDSPHVSKRKLFKLLSLKDYKFVEIKRESIDKKVMRKFISVLNKSKHEYSDKKEIVDQLKDYGLPPTVVNGKAYKSFNTSYMLLVFSIDGIKELYDAYIQDKLQEVLSSVYCSYSIQNNESKSIIERYVLDIGNLFCNE